MSSENKQLLLHVILLLVISALMGGLFPMIKIMEQSITPLTLALSRAALASSVLLVVVGGVMKRDLTLLISQWRPYATLGIILGVFFVSIAEAEVYITASLTSLFTCVIPISTFLIATLILHWERFTFARLGGSALALAGVAMFIGLEKVQFDRSQITGIAIIVCGFVIYAIYLLYSRASKLDPFLAATGTMIYVSLFLAIAAFTLEEPLQLHPSEQAVAATLIMGILSTGLAYVLLQYLITNAGAVFAATSGYFIPIFAILASYFLVGETIEWLQLVGLGMTLVGAWLVNRTPASPISLE